MWFRLRQRLIPIVAVLILFLIVVRLTHLSPSYRIRHFMELLEPNSSPRPSWTPDPETAKAELQETSDFTFDIIVNLFQEEVEKIAASLMDIRSLPVLQNYSRVRVFVYVKDENVSVSELREVLETPHIFQIPNRGRETGTYLGHILDNWDDLASHNMFMQAQVHHHDDARNKLLDYLQPNTGVLNLGFYELCDCLACKDPWDSDRIFSRLEELYSIINREFCPNRIALSYLGQIVASKTRIQSRPLQLYKYLKDILESSSSHPIHSDPRQDMFEDSITNPYFGHTMERAYTILWGCEEPSIVERCGSGFGALANRRGPTDPDNKCQCLDF
jgi:hypothetical protein